MNQKFVPGLTQLTDEFLLRDTSASSMKSEPDFIGSDALND